ncbi:MAG TPA: hypothetical protein VGO61_12180 [Steroidobacteraceae bacterium]|nr:hypothetical protein [Steroidobacteraceae bacterium]
MSSVLRTAWTLLSVPAVLVLACAYGFLWLMPLAPKFPLQGLAGLSIIVGLAMLAMRIAKVLDTGVWRLLPNGFRTIIRAIGLIMLVITLLPGRIGDRAVPGPLSGVPFGGLFANVIVLTLLSVLLLAGIGRRVPRLVILAYLFGCFVALHYLVAAFAGNPPFWFASAGLCAAAWLYASFGKLPFLRADTLWRRLHDRPASSTVAFARIRMPFIADSPARVLLRSRRGARTGLPFAALIVVSWAAFQQLIVGGRIGSGDFIFIYPSVLWVTVFLVVVVSEHVGAAARTLWLRWGDSRRELFRLAERMLFLDATILCTIAWGTVTLFAWLRGIPIDAPGALKMLAAHISAAVAAIYLALAFSTFHAWWQKVICAVLGVGAVTLLSFRWLDAFGESSKAIGRVEPELLLVLFLILLALRTLASWRWKGIDWIYFRQIRRKQ